MTTIEAIIYMNTHTDEICEMIFSENDDSYIENLFLMISFGINGSKHLLCFEEPLVGCVPYTVSQRNTIPMECTWVLSKHGKQYVQNLIEKLGCRK